MDPVQMVNRLTSNSPFTKNYPLIAQNIPCNVADGTLVADSTVDPKTFVASGRPPRWQPGGQLC
jgi:hypothetical protein